MLGKNVINEYPGFGTSSSSSSSVSSTSGWGAPADGSRTNIATLVTTTQDIPANTAGYGLLLNQINGQYAASGGTPLIIQDDNGTPLGVTRYVFPQQRDKEYLTFYQDYGYQDGALKIDVLKDCWLLIEGTAVTSSPGGVPTQSSAICIRRATTTGVGGGPVWYGPPIAGGSFTNEPGAGGLALPLHSIMYYRAGTTLKIGVATTHQITLAAIQPSAGTMSLQTAFFITRISN